MKTQKTALQLAFLADTLHQRPTVTQNHFLTLHSRYEPHLFPSVLDITGPPHLRHQFIPRDDWRSESRLELFDIGRVAPTERLQKPMTGAIPAEKAMHDCTSETHLLAWFRGCVKWIIVAIQPVISLAHSSWMRPDMMVVPIE